MKLYRFYKTPEQGFELYRIEGEKIFYVLCKNHRGEAGQIYNQNPLEMEQLSSVYNYNHYNGRYNGLYAREFLCVNDKEAVASILVDIL